MIRFAGLTLEQAIATATARPARLLGRPEPKLEAGEPANLVRFGLEAGHRFVLRETCVDGNWVGPEITESRI